MADSEDALFSRSYTAAIAASANVSTAAVTIFNTTLSRRRLLSGVTVNTQVTFPPSYYSTDADNYLQLLQNTPAKVGPPNFRTAINYGMRRSACTMHTCLA